LHNVGKVTQGVACHDRSDASKDDNTDTSPAEQSGQTRTHEKADMIVVSAAPPGEPEY